MSTNPQSPQGSPSEARGSQSPDLTHTDLDSIPDIEPSPAGAEGRQSPAAVDPLDRFRKKHAPAPGAPQEEGPAGVDLEALIATLSKVCTYIEGKEDLRPYSDLTPGKGLHTEVLFHIADLAKLRDGAHPPEDTPIEAAGDLEAAVDAFGDAVEALTKAEYRSGSDREIRPYKEAYYEARAKILEWGHLATRAGTPIEKAARAVELGAMLGRANYVTHPHHEWLSITNRADDTYVTVQLPGIIAKEIAFRINSFEALSGLPQEGAAGEGGSILDGGPIAPPAPTSGEAQEPNEGGAANV